LWSDVEEKMDTLDVVEMIYSSVLCIEMAFETLDEILYIPSCTDFRSSLIMKESIEPISIELYCS
jgi:hypothetical protein